MSDVIRFNPAGTGGNAGYPASVVFYSVVDPMNAPADTWLPGSLYGRVFTLIEGPLGGGVTGVTYTPNDAQPGFVAGFSVTYTIISDTPEPATVSTAALAVAAFAFVFWRKNVRQRAKLHA